MNERPSPLGAYRSGMTQPERSSQIYSYKYSSQNSFLYDVKREVYNEENFQQEHKRRVSSSGTMDINITTFTHNVQCSCSWHRFLRCMYMIFPFLEWTCLYRFKDWLLGDLLAGLSVGIVQIPEGLTLSLMTRQLIPPLNVAYTAFCSSVIYVIFGSCHQMSIGPFFLVSALMINVLKERPFNYGHLVMGTFIKDDFSSPTYFLNYNRSLNVVQTTTFLTGIFQNIVNYCIGLPKANSTSILLFLTTAVALRINKCIKVSFNQYPINFPMELILILGFTVLAHKINLVTETSRNFIEIIPYSFLFPSLPNFSNFFSRLILPAISLSIVSSFMVIFLGKKIAGLHNYRINSNQDLIAIGFCNIVSSFFKSYVYSAAIARTIIQDKAGGRQQFASLVGAGVMLLLMMKAAQFFYELPNAVLAGVVLSNVLPYLETIYNLPSLWKQNQYDFVVWIFTFLSSIFLGLDIGLLMSIVFAFFITTLRSHRTKILILGQIPNTNIYRSINDYRKITTIPGVKIFQCCNSITFVNVHHLKNKLLKEVGMVRVPLKEEEIFMLFTQHESCRHENPMCRCSCNCDELEPPPRIVYTERFENKEALDASSVNLVRCSHLESINISPSVSDEQMPNTRSSSSQRIQGQNYGDMEKVRIANHPSRNSLLPPPDTTESQERSLIPYSDMSFQPSTHTIILDFSMVQYVDFHALVVLRQMCNSFQNANILVLIAGCHPSVVRMFEKNDFFDEGITKAQLFLSLHDAVLFALSRKFPELSELSEDESETVIQETYSDVNKNDIPRHKSSNFPESHKNPSPTFAKGQAPVEEESEFDLEMEPMLGSERDAGLDSYLDLDQELENDTEVDLPSEMYPETEPESELELEAQSDVDPKTPPETEIETDPEMELEVERVPQPKSRSRAYTYPQRQQRQSYSEATQTQSQSRPQTPSVERRGQHMDSYSPSAYDDESP
ncbi:testis anion transporter 1 isoform X1 [Marmota marmota marmota]|uniref:testis anion transporter 1 isoform X1 n=1 Tax=Marmota marmota marmota TaxID=9994 RepID=UPI0020933CC7|nr:testis anion transporter 1 isoform X1 [Marmota marmota marmota]